MRNWPWQFAVNRRTHPSVAAEREPRFRNISNLQQVSLVFLLAESLDLLTTLVGIVYIPEIWEANKLILGFGGWTQALLFKVAAVFITVAIIEAMNKPLQLGSIKVFTGRYPKAIWLVPVVAGLPMIWNILVIILEKVY